MRTPESIISSLRCRLSLSPSLNRNFLVVHIMNDFLISLFPQLPSSHYISISTSFHRSLLNASPLCRIRLLPLSATNCRYLSLSLPQIFPINRSTGSHSHPFVRHEAASVCALASVRVSVRPGRADSGRSCQCRQIIVIIRCLPPDSCG